MRRRFCLLIAGLLFLGSSAAQGVFRFTAWSDTCPAESADNQARFQWTLSQMNLILESESPLPVFHVVAGDFYDWATTNTDIGALTPSFSSWSFAPGNHDLPELGTSNSSWDYSNARFLFLNEFRCPADLCDFSVGPRVCPHTYDWLAAELTGAPPAVFVVGHYPFDGLAGDSAERARFWKLLNDHQVVAFLCGHTHVYDVYSDSTGPTRQINTGSAGQSTSLDFLVFDVGDQTVDVSVYRGQESQTFTGGYSFTLDIPVPIYAAHNPSPSAGATGVAVNAALSWSPGTGATSHDVYLWKEGTAPVCVSAGQSDTTFTPATLLDFDTVYWWCVDEHFPGGTVVEGENWTFRTAPATVIAKAQSETVISGQLLDATSYANTHESDDSCEKIQEVLNIPNKNGYSVLEHVWTFDVPAGSYIELHVEAYHSASTDGDDFTLSYSTDGTNYASMLTVTKTADDNNAQVYTLPASLQGRLYVKAQDTDHTKAAQTLDTLYVDTLCIISSQIPIPEPPRSPSAEAGPDQTVTDTNGDGSEIVTLNAGGSFDPDGTIVSYAWDTDGDGETEVEGEMATWSFSTGVHTVTLVVTDNDGLTGSDQVLITVQPAGVGTHVADLDGFVSAKGNSGHWTALVAVTVVDQNGSPVPGATVSGAWSGSASGTSTGVTGNDGIVTLGSNIIKTGNTATFTVADITHATLPYRSTDNQDPEGDSDGTSIVVAP
jgi:hypothetical protein